MGEKGVPKCKYSQTEEEEKERRGRGGGGEQNLTAKIFLTGDAVTHCLKQVSRKTKSQMILYRLLIES